MPDDLTRLPALKRLGRAWRRGYQHRLYFEGLAALYGLEVTRYKTGNVASATLHGRPISNTQAGALLEQLSDSNLWFDVHKGVFMVQKPLPLPMAGVLIESLRAQADAMLMTDA